MDNQKKMLLLNLQSAGTHLSAWFMVLSWTSDFLHHISDCPAAGASQVKWNKKNQHLLASSHDGDIRVWDKRVSGGSDRSGDDPWPPPGVLLLLWLHLPPVCLQKPSTAVEYVAAHLSKIHGLDWHPDNEFVFATSSQDNSVKVKTNV